MYGTREKRGWETGYTWERESEESGNKFRTIAQYFAIEKHTETGTTKEGGGNWAYKVREAGN